MYKAGQKVILLRNREKIMNQAHFNWCLFFFPKLPLLSSPHPIKFPPPKLQQRGSSCAVEQGSIFQVSDYFSRPSYCQNFDSSPTLLVDWWCQLGKDSTTSSQFFQDVFFFDFKNSFWVLQKEVALKGTSSLVPQPARWLTVLENRETDELVPHSVLPVGWNNL